MLQGNIFRGGEGGLAVQVNTVEGLDIRELLERQEGAPGEETVYVVVADALKTWYRTKYPLGKIDSEIVHRTEVDALVKAFIYDENERLLATGYGSASTKDITGFRFVEAAETRAITRALRSAGFGCQLTARSFDGDTEDPAFAPPPASPEGVDGSIDTKQPATLPEKINGSKKVSANDPAKVLDVAELTELVKASELPPPKKSKARKAKGESQKEEEVVNTPSDSEVNAGDADEQPDSTPEIVSESESAKDPTEADVTKAEVPLSEEPASESTSAEEGVETVSDPEPEPIPEPGSDSTQADEAAVLQPVEMDLSVEQQALKAATLMPDVEPSNFDARFFGEGSVNPDEFYANPPKNGKPALLTPFKNWELQKVIRFFEDSNLAPLVTVVSESKPEINGLLLSELNEDEKWGLMGKKYIQLFAENYTGGNLPLKAAAMLIAWQNSQQNRQEVA